MSSEKLSCGDPACGPGFVKWNRLEGPVPHVAVIGVVHDGKSALIVKRGSGVRSARNCWSLPSGLVDVGETIREAFVREVMEETHVKAMHEWTRVIDCYENILHDEQWHWVMILMESVVDDLGTARNREPDKHDEVRTVKLDDLYTMLFDEKEPWQDSMRKTLSENWPKFSFYDKYFWRRK